MPRSRRVGRSFIVVLLLAVLVPAAARAASAAPAAADCGSRFPAYAPRPVAKGGMLHANVPVRMSDGVVLKADVTLPLGLRGPYPVALTITGYGKSTPIATFGNGSAGLVRQGYATVLVDDRGTGSSGGTWDSWGPRTIADYGEVLDWIVRQPWSDGRIGITGTSYMAITSLMAASTGRSSVKGVFAVVPMGDAYRDIVEAGSELNVAFIPFWVGLVTGLGLMPHGSRDNPQDLADHLLGITQFQVPAILDASVGGEDAFDGPFWQQRSPLDVIHRVTAPTFIVGGLDDIFQRGEPLLYEALRSQGTDARLLIGPWTHAAAGTGLPRDGVPNTTALQLQWFDQHVRGLPAHTECIPQVTQFVRGANHYVSSPTWPVPGLHAQRWHLRGTGGLTTTAPGVHEPSRSYLEVPITGICSRSSAQWLIGLIDGTPCAKDDRLGEALSLTYTSAPFRTTSVINGPIEADLWLTTTGTDAAVSVSVSDVAPDGTSRGLTNGLLLASQRAVDASRGRLLDGQSIQPWHPFTQVSTRLVVPGRPVLVPIEVFPTSAALAPGHRLRITVSPFDIPHALPSLPGALRTFAGTVQILSDAAHPSSVVLPVIG